MTNESPPSKQKLGMEAGDRKRMCKGDKLESNDDVTEICTMEQNVQGMPSEKAKQAWAR